MHIPYCSFGGGVGQPIAPTEESVCKYLYSKYPSEEASLRVEEFSKLWPCLQGVFDAKSLASLRPHRLTRLDCICPKLVDI